MYYKFRIANDSENKHYIVLFSFYKYEKIMIEPYYILSKSYEEAMNEAGAIKEMHREFKLECLIELNIIPNKENIIFDFGIGEEKSKQDSNTKFCPFSFENGKMHPCQKHKCMAFRHIIDGSGEYVAEYCQLIDRKEK